MTDTLFLRSDELDGLATPAEYVDAVRSGYREYGEGAPAEPRTKLVNRDPAGMLTTYAAILPETGAMGGYTYSAGFGARDAWFMTPLFDAESGEPIALLDGASMNPYKTGAAGGVGVDALAREDATVAGIIGSGAQARGQLKAIAAVRDLQVVRVFSPTREHREAFATDLSAELNLDVQAVDSSAEAAGGADIVVTATNASSPVIDRDTIDPGTHITAMGQYNPNKHELDAETIADSVYVPDIAARATKDAGSFINAIDAGLVDEGHIHGDLGDVLAGAAPGRQSDEEITVFDSGGTGIETVAAAYMLYQKAIDAGLGTTIDFAPASEALTGQ
ncbi:ornithine cyclodeaminase family protein [Halalkalirubrum salinum]|uniref:ornithine cyclodeaminase family protein n=1 Tax=Halalkalirubrum salinum TaxID=2563889 RepID=UPI0010FAD3EE|nr:ornithine cyclodeaminase family protein [Halalkalirubrum salinum]